MLSSVSYDGQSNRDDGGREAAEREAMQMLQLKDQTFLLPM